MTCKYKFIRIYNLTRIPDNHLYLVCILSILNDESFLATGFENAAVACCATGTFEMSYMCDRYNPFTCTDANKYVFWDSFHPSEKTNNIIASYVVKNCLAEFL